MKADSSILALLLAAGKGTRMNTSIPKPLIPVTNYPIIHHIINALTECQIAQIAIVIGHQADIVKSQLGNQYEYVLQSEQKGMAHAVDQADSLISQYEETLVFVGDSPLIQHDSIQRLITYHHDEGAVCSFLTSIFPIHFPYARVIRNADGNVQRCVEERHASVEEKKITEYLTSHYLFNSDTLLKYLNEVEADPETNESYLTNIIEILVEQGLKVVAVHINDYRQLVGLNTPEDLIWAEQVFKDRYG